MTKCVPRLEPKKTPTGCLYLDIIEVVLASLDLSGVTLCGVLHVKDGLLSEGGVVIKSQLGIRGINLENITIDRDNTFYVSSSLEKFFLASLGRVLLHNTLKKNLKTQKLPTYRIKMN